MTRQLEETFFTSTNMGTKVIQVTNIAPQTTRDQMHTLFGFVGKIEDIKLYPTVRDVSFPVQSRICYVKYSDCTSVSVAQHLTNTVFIDRAFIVTPYQAKDGEIPDEYRALDIVNQANVIPGLSTSDSKLPAHIVNRIEGMPPNQVITTYDPVLASKGLPTYPPLPITYDSKRIEEIRRTVVVVNVEESMSDELLDFFIKAGDVKYIRFCTRDNDSSTYALIEFNDHSSIIPALQMNGSKVAGRIISVYHSTQAIAKPIAKSNEAAQKEIEEAMTRVKEAQSMISAAIDPVIGILSKDKKRSRSNSRSRARSRSKSKYKRRSRSQSHRSKRRSRSRNSRARKSRSKGSRGSPLRNDRRRRSGSRKRSKDRKGSRSKGDSKIHRRKSKERPRSRSHSKKSQSKERRCSNSQSKKSRSKERHRSRSRSKKSRSKSRSQNQTSQSPSYRLSRSKIRKLTKEYGSESPKKKSKSPK